MRTPLIWLLCVLVSLSFALPAAAGSPAKRAELEKLAVNFENQRILHQQQIYFNLLNNPDAAQLRLNLNPDIQLMYVDDRGVPRFYRTTNLTAARTDSTDQVWPGGATGYNLTGSATSTSEFAVWDGGGVLTTHQELTGRVTQMDSPSGTHPHSTHVAGTMAAGGVQPNAQGMSYQADLAAYDWNSDTSEMATAGAAGLRVSNHSYGFATGWEYDGDWYWFGDIYVSQTEDYGFGFYGSEAQNYDQIAFNAPNYLICKSAGNDRNDPGPGAGGGHWYWDGGWTWGTTTRDGDGAPSGYDCIGWIGTAKNILSVGAVNDIATGYSQPTDVVQTSFSSWGPTDDGRIKPDIVANGAGLYSCSDASNTSYVTYSGTSMSSPNAAGSVNLLEDHYEAIKGSTPRSATIKAVILHTADEAGPNDGPDYQNGWGLLNTESAANVIAADASGVPGIREADLNDSATDTYYFAVMSMRDVKVSVVWTDPAGTPPSAAVDPTDKMLVNDIDVRVEHVPTTITYNPWRLDGANPANAASKGDNDVDNVEIVEIENAMPGAYVVTVTHKGTLSGGNQEYSIVCSERLSLTPVDIPTLSEWGLIGLAALLIGAGLVLIRRRRAEVR